MISINATLFVQVGLFLILLFVMNRIMIQPIHRIINERDERLRLKREELSAIQAEIRRLAADYEAELRRADEEARQSQLAMKSEANDEARKMVMTAQEQVNAVQEKVRSEVARELAVAREKLREQAEMLSRSVTEKVLGRSV